ncbi:MAG: DNA polymerase [Pseudomonadota bacterium]
MTVFHRDNDYTRTRDRSGKSPARPHQGTGFDPKGRVRLICDIEANGFLESVTRIHSICILDDATGELFSGVPDEYRETYLKSPQGQQALKDGVKIISIEAALEMLACANEIVGHNFIKYDYPVLRKLYPDWDIKGIITDTLILSRLMFINLRDRDFKRFNEGNFSGSNIGKHSLEAWGERLGTWKGEYKDLPIHAYRTAKEHGLSWKKIGGEWVVETEAGEIYGRDEADAVRFALKKLKIKEEPFRDWLPEMQAYCDQDVRVSKSAWDHMKVIEFPSSPIELEHRCAAPLVHSEQCGFIFDMEKAEPLVPLLMAEKAELEMALREAFDDWYEPVKRDPTTGEGVTRVFKRDAKRKMTHEGVGTITVRRFGKNGKELKPYVGPPLIIETKGVEFTPIKRESFDPGSRPKVAKVLIRKYGWKPTTFTKTGQPEVNDKTLKGLQKYPECRLLARYFLLVKRLGQLAEGDAAWINHATLNELGLYQVATRYNAQGTVTFRASHYEPNLAQVPAAKASVPYGPEFRELFTVPPGWKLVGTDLEGLENNVLGHYLARYDKGDYLEVCKSGDSHWHNVQAMGMVPHGTKKQTKEWLDDDKTIPNPDYDPMHGVYRDKVAKTLWYAFIYGCAAEKAGTIYTSQLPLSENEVLRLVYEPKHAWIAKWLKRKGRRPTRRLVAKVAKGSELLEDLIEGMPALKALLDKLEEKHKKTKKSEHGPHVLSLDGRRIYCRSTHSMLNSLCQSAGAVICKEWMCLVWEKLLARGYKPGWDGDFVLCVWVHDELQIACRADIADEVAAIAKEAAREVGPKYKFRGVTAADVTQGFNWKECH